MARIAVFLFYIHAGQRFTSSGSKLLGIAKKLLRVKISRRKVFIAKFKMKHLAGILLDCAL